MKKTAFSQPVFSKTISALLALGLAASSLTFGGAVSKLEYTRSLVDGLGFKVEDASDAYKRETTKDENIIYTAFQMGLLTGVSWDFENPMTESEREIILGNAMAIYNEIHGEDGVEQETPEQTEQVSEDSNALQSPSDFNWETKWGAIRQPSDLNMNDEIWSDEEFREMLEFDISLETLNDAHFEDALHINREGTGHRWYYEPVEGHFHFLIFNANGDDYWVDVDEMTDGRFFQSMKTVLYNALKYDMNISLSENNKSVHFSIQVKDRGWSNINLFFNIDPRKSDLAFQYVEGYDSTSMNIIDEWHFKNLFDYSLYREMTGDELYTLTGQERIEFFQSIDFSESCYTDFLYGLFEHMYGDDSLEIYHEIMSEYMYSTYSTIVDNYETTNSHMIETRNHLIFKFDPKYYDSYFGIVNK